MPKIKTEYILPGNIQRSTDRIVSQARKASKSASTPYTGNFVAPVDPRQTEALDLYEQFARGLGGTDLTQSALQGIQNVYAPSLRGDLLYAESNPYFQSAVDAVLRPINEQFSNISNLTRSRAIGQGAFGGSREALLQAQLASDLERNIGDTTAKMALDNYNRERQYMLQAPQAIGGAIQAGVAPANMLYDIGGQHRQFEQENLENQILRFNERYINAPFRGLIPEAGILGNVPTGYKTVQRVPSEDGGSGLGSVIGGVLGAVVGSIFPVIGTGVGAALGGGIGGLFD